MVAWSMTKTYCEEIDFETWILISIRDSGVPRKSISYSLWDLIKFVFLCTFVYVGSRRGDLVKVQADVEIVWVFKLQI